MGDGTSCLDRPSRGCYNPGLPARSLVVPALLLLTLSPSEAATSDWFTMPVPAGVFAGAGLPDTGSPALSLLTLIRMVHDTPDPGADRAHLSRVEEALGTRNGIQLDLPLPLPPALFEQLPEVDASRRGGLFGALLHRRSASLLYSGLMAMDAPTRHFLASQPELVNILARRGGVVAAFGRSVRVADGRVDVPGGEAAAPLWEQLVGARVSEPAEFIGRLFEMRAGRTAYLFDAVAHLPGPQQRFALGLWMRSADARLDRLEALHDAFSRIDSEWSVAEYPFIRPMHDAALLLRLVPADETGSPPAWFRRGFWRAALDGDDLPRNARRAFRSVLRGPPADAAWLSQQISGTPPHVRAGRFFAFAFGARRAAQVDASTVPGLVLAVRAFGRYPALMLGLERMGIGALASYEVAARAAERLDAIGDPLRAATALTQFQGALAIVDRAVRAGRATPQQATQLVASLSTLPLEDGRYGTRVAEWMEQTLLPQVGGDTPGASTEASVLTAQADRSAGADGRRFEWEGLRYVVDTTWGDVARFEMVRARQGGERLDEAIARLRRAPVPGSSRDDAERTFARALAGVVYAPHQGDPLELFQAAAQMYLRHDFGLTRAGTPMSLRRRLPWARPRVLSNVSEQMRVTGALLGLDLALSRMAVRRLIADRMPAPPRLNMSDREVFFDSAALVNPRALSDEQLAAIAAALARGRARVVAAADAAARDVLAAEAGVSAVRRQLISWMQDGHVSLFSLAEILRLGDGRLAPDPLGVSDEPISGAFRLAFPDATPWEAFSGRAGAGHISSRVPDLALRVAELLVEIGAPAALLPGVLAFAVQDFVDEAPSMHTDDWYALVHEARTLERERVEDYIAAVAARGPLRPEGTR